ncbi:MAG: hypothetical protein V4661_13780, partial [Pseudomonadota bacterium]
MAVMNNHADSCSVPMCKIEHSAKSFAANGKSNWASLRSGKQLTKRDIGIYSNNCRFGLIDRHPKRQERDDPGGASGGAAPKSFGARGPRKAA